jgi:hypothetical protein
MTRLLAALLAAVLLCACYVGGCNVGCSLPDCIVTTTDGVTISGSVKVDTNTVTISGPQGDLTVPPEKVLRIERTPKTGGEKP